MAAILAVLVASIITSLGMTGPAEHAAEGAIRQRLGKVERVNVHIDRGHRSPFSRTVPEIRVEVKGFSLRGEAGSPMRVTGSSRMNGEVSKIVVAAEDFEVVTLHAAQRGRARATRGGPRARPRRPRGSCPASSGAGDPRTSAR